MLVLAVFGILLALIAIRVPIGLSLISVSFVGIALETNMRAAIGSISRLPYELATNWSFSAVPMFLLMGFLCSETGMTRGLFQASRVLLSRLPGALANASVLASALFAAASGSSVATAAAMSRIAVPEMLRSGYDKGLACGTVAASGTLGSLIPPSIIMILYGVYADVSIGKLFMAGVIPGLLSVAIYMGMITLRAARNPDLAGGNQPLDEDMRSKRELILDVLPLPLLIGLVMGSIFFGVATPTEAGALGALGALAISLATRQLSFPAFWTALRETAISYASVFIIVVGGALLTRYVAVAGIGGALEDLFAELPSGPLVLIIATAVLFVVLGMFIDSIGLLLLAVPLVLPIAQTLDMDLIWLGIILVKLLEIGLITPPVGLNVYIIKSTLGDRVSLPEIFRGVGWFIAMDLLTLAILIAFPAITLWLPSLM